MHSIQPGGSDPLGGRHFDPAVVQLSLIRGETGGMDSSCRDSAALLSSFDGKECNTLTQRHQYYKNSHGCFSSCRDIFDTALGTTTVAMQPRYTSSICHH